MNAFFSVRNVVGALVMLSVLCISGCGKFSGKYKASNKEGTMTIDFKSSDKADVSVMGATVEAPYQKDGNTITIHNPEKGGKKDDLVLTLESDGSLTSKDMPGVKFMKE